MQSLCSKSIILCPSFESLTSYRRTFFRRLTRADIKGLYKDVATMGITLANCIGPKNILVAPSSPMSLPSLPSPFTKRVHQWRLIDFDRARKTPWTRKTISVDHMSWLDNMFDTLPLFMPNEDFKPPEDDSDVV